MMVKTKSGGNKFLEEEEKYVSINAKTLKMLVGRIFGH